MAGQETQLFVLQPADFGEIYRISAGPKTWSQPGKQVRNRNFESLGQHLEGRKAHILLSPFHIAYITSINSHQIRHLDLCPALLLS